MAGVHILQKRYLVESRWRILFVLPMTIAVVGLYAIADQPYGLATGGPILLLLVYGSLVLMTCYREVRSDAKGFVVRFAPLPVGMTAETHVKAEITHLFPRYIREGVAKGVFEDRYYAAVELTSGRWLNVSGHFTDWAGASAACADVARYWGISEIAAGRNGFPRARDAKRIAMVGLWSGAFIAAMIWGAIAETQRYSCSVASHASGLCRVLRAFDVRKR